MLPECLYRVLADRAEFLAGQPLPVSDGIEPLVYVLLTGCVILVNRNGAAASVSWPGDLIVAPSESGSSAMILKAVSESVCIRGPRAGVWEEISRQPELARWAWLQQERREIELHRRVELLTAESVENRMSRATCCRKNSAMASLPRTG